MGSKTNISNFVRAGEQSENVVDELGPLAHMLGTWMGSGWNLIAVPDQKEAFRLLVRPFIETLTVTPVGAPVPNRSGPGEQNMFIHGVKYEQLVADAETHRPLHIENGMWLWLGEDAKDDKKLVRQSSIPHGDMLLAMGNSNVTPGRPPIDPTLTSRPRSRDTGKELPDGYLKAGAGDSYFSTEGGFDRLFPNRLLINTLEKQQVQQSVNLFVSTAPGAVVNIPFVIRNANAVSLSSIFWIETILDQDTGKTVQQLQYSQTVDLDFPDGKAPELGSIIWPHISIATLAKQ